MSDYDQLLMENMRSEIFSVPVADENYRYILRNKRSAIQQSAIEIHEKRPSHILFLGSGASMCVLHLGKYFLDKYSALNAELLTGPEYLTRKPPRMKTDNTFAIVASYSGATKDTLDGVHWLQKLEIPYLVITKDTSTKIAQKCQRVLTYDSKTLYTGAAFELYLLLTFLLKMRREFREHKTFLNDLQALPRHNEDSAAKAKELGKSIGKALQNEDPIYVIADGVNWGLGYQIAYTTIMEYLKRNAAFIRACEFRHGPLEVVKEGQPTMLFLLGADESRPYCETTFNFCRRHGAKVYRMDVNDLVDTPPLLSPLVLFPATQWMLLQMATDSGINLDKYLYMHMVPYE
jgi:fructoselysine 6-phosphate deglycase